MLHSYFLGLLLLISLSAAQVVIFDGTWANHLQASCGKLTKEPGSSVVWKFSGTYINVRGPPPADPATIVATLDGAPSPLNPSGTECIAFLYQSASLPLGSHILNLTFLGPASNGKNFLSITSFACGMDPNITLTSAMTSTSASPSSTVRSVNPSSAATDGISLGSVKGADPWGSRTGANPPSTSEAPSGTSIGVGHSGISTSTNASSGPTALKTSGTSIGLNPSRPTTGINSSGTSPGATPAAVLTDGNHSGASTGANHSGTSTSADHSLTSTGTNRSRTSTDTNHPGPSIGANESSTITETIPSSTAASTFTAANPSRTSTSRFCDFASISGAYQSCGVKFGITAASVAPSVTSISTNASGTSTGTNHSTASTGGAFGGAFGVAALVVAIIYQYFKAPSPSVSSDYYFWFVLPLPIKFRGKTLKDAEITVVLEPARLALTEKKPERGFTLSGFQRHELVAWKVFTLSAGEEGQHVRLPRNLGFGDVEDSEGSLAAGGFFNFAPLRTLVTRTKEGSWKSARFIIPGLTAMVVGKNAATQPVDFALGTYHARRGKTEGIFHPFGVVRRVLNSQFCVVPQCEELVVNAYITQSIEQRQLLPEIETNEDPNAAPLPAFEDDDNEDGIPLLETNSSYTNRLILGLQQNLNAAPRPIIEDDDDDDLGPKILSRGLLGENGQPVSGLKQRTRWDLVDDDQGVRLKMVTEARGHRRQWNDGWTYI
ncbi:hypothetical protein DFH08DRAFT_1088879 [Mycena albidolilacea]|uniref:Uncharacterized protein n=1 Tax=Mycena albidolilacea TaxID=1033008 RepID=A0AAD6Z3W7_9AGAR|nr:hypothetical protein DFH08DRAFT_1088879 [Mycena albidolilacea]